MAFAESLCAEVHDPVRGLLQQSQEPKRGKKIFFKK